MIVILGVVYVQLHTLFGFIVHICFETFFCICILVNGLYMSLQVLFYRLDFDLTFSMYLKFINPCVIWDSKIYSVL